MLSYRNITDEIVRQLDQIVPGRVAVGEKINDDFSHDEMPIYGKYMPEAIVEVQTTEEVAAVLRLCHEAHIPVTPRGAGTGLVGGAVAVSGGIILSTTRMNRILSYDLENLFVHVQPGVLLRDLQEDTAKHGLMYPPDPGEKSATLGGNVSTNAGGMRAVKYGTTRDYVKAMTVVLPTGEVVRLGSSVCKTSSGYSLLQLIAGSEGTLGVITELVLKLVPLPGAEVSLMIPFETLEECIGAVPQFRMRRIQPQSLEFMERDIILSSESYLGKNVFPHTINGTDVGAYLLMTLEGESMETLEPEIERAAEAALEFGAIDILLADTPVKKREVWAARGSFLEAIMAESEFLDECDVVVPISKIPAFLHFVHGLQEEIGLTVKSFGHADYAGN